MYVKEKVTSENCLGRSVEQMKNVKLKNYVSLFYVVYFIFSICLLNCLFLYLLISKGEKESSEILDNIITEIFKVSSMNKAGIEFLLISLCFTYLICSLIIYGIEYYIIRKRIQWVNKKENALTENTIHSISNKRKKKKDQLIFNRIFLCSLLFLLGIISYQWIDLRIYYFCVFLISEINKPVVLCGSFLKVMHRHYKVKYLNERDETNNPLCSNTSSKTTNNLDIPKIDVCFFFFYFFLQKIIHSVCPTIRCFISKNPTSDDNKSPAFPNNHKTEHTQKENTNKNEEKKRRYKSNSKEERGARDNDTNYVNHQNETHTQKDKKEERKNTINDTESLHNNKSYFCQLNKEEYIKLKQNVFKYNNYFEHFKKHKSRQKDQKNYEKDDQTQTEGLDLIKRNQKRFHVLKGEKENIIIDNFELDEVPTEQPQKEYTLKVEEKTCNVNSKHELPFKKTKMDTHECVPENLFPKKSCEETVALSELSELEYINNKNTSFYVSQNKTNKEKEQNKLGMKSQEINEVDLGSLSQSNDNLINALKSSKERKAITEYDIHLFEKRIHQYLLDATNRNNLFTFLSTIQRNIEFINIFLILCVKGFLMSINLHNFFTKYTNDLFLHKILLTLIQCSFVFAFHLNVYLYKRKENVL